MAGASNLLIGVLNLGQVVTKVKRDKAEGGMIEFTTLSGSTRYQELYKDKYVYTFECDGTVQDFEDLRYLLLITPVQSIQYHKTNWRIDLTAISCLCQITDEDYSDYLAQPEDGAEATIRVKYTLVCKEI